MNKITKPSTKSPYKVYLEPDSDECLLEVKRAGKHFLYEIQQNGDSKLLLSSDIPYQPEPDQKDEVYYLDYLHVATLQKIQILTENYNYQQIIDGLINLLKQIEDNSYQNEDFSMEHSYLFEDYKDAINQLYEFTNEEEYLTRLNSLNQFFDNFFYYPKKKINDDSKEQIFAILKQEINFLEKLQNN